LAIAPAPMSRSSPAASSARVLIARALASSPDLLVMDEPTAGVDQANQISPRRSVLARLASAGSTQLIVTHEIDALAEVITRVDRRRRTAHITFDGTPQAYAAQGPPRRPCPPHPASGAPVPSPGSTDATAGGHHD
jgi:zinc transport system ATP-binding protein